MEKEKQMPIFFPPHLLQEKMKSKEIIKNNMLQNKQYIRENIKTRPIFRMRL